MRLPIVCLMLWASSALFSVDLPPLVKEAVQLELEGRSGEALDRYRAALSTEPSLVQDESSSASLTVWVLSKAAHLSIDLGFGEEAWDLGGRLLASPNQGAAEAGTLVRMRLLRLQGRVTEALALFDSYTKDWPLPPPGPGLVSEVWRIRGGSQGKAPYEALLTRAGGPAAWVLKGDGSWLVGPTEILGIQVQPAVRLQLGVFKDWGNALTLLDMLREKGWSPFTDVKTNPAGEKLHTVYLVSRQPASDKARLESQGLLQR